MQTYLNTEGSECVIIDNQDGSTWSGLKSAYDEMIAVQALTPTLPITTEPPTEQTQEGEE